jgi:DNA modification methylase
VPVDVIRGDASTLPLPDESVDLIVTSPPYWALRSYTDGGEHYGGQIGAEPTPAGYIDSLIACTREWMRVLKPTGSLWVNLGDKYAADPRGPNGESSGLTNGAQHRPGERAGTAGTRPRGSAAVGVPKKSLLGLPWRYAIRCVDDLGLILRAEVIWSKPNGLPESVTDRVRRAHETWFHFTRSPRYFSAVDAIREPHQHPGRGMSPDDRRVEGRLGGRAVRGAREADRPRGDNSKAGNPLGKLPGSVWTVATQPLKVPAELGVDHFAAFPTEWPRRIITGWSPSGICTDCGEGRRPLIARPAGSSWHNHGADVRSGQRQDGAARNKAYRARMAAGVGPTIVGETCACSRSSAPTRPAVVLDPFGGTGTTALVADVLGRHGISVDMSADYCRLAAWRTTDPKQRERAGAAPVKRPKPAPKKPDPGFIEQHLF